MIILGLIGEKLSGKDTLTHYLVTRYRAEHLRYSFLLDDILRKLGQEVSRENEMKLSVGLRSIFDNTILSQGLAAQIKHSTSNLIILNGIRYQDELDKAKEWGAKIVYISTPIEIRYQRYLERHEKADDAKLSFDDFVKQESAPTEVSIPKLATQADVTLENTGNMETLYKAADDYLKQLGL
jgi:dephospho-CoA kinase